MPLQGKWFPHAFIGTIANLQRYASREDDALVSDVADAWKTMALVETCYRSESSNTQAINSFGGA